ncbi:hypothetical protein AAG584_23005 [Vreelandella titanicae]|uniref:hypothetical protein n=1 Tax=Vreelandella titanicae TaxID=664683 RepID=UPI00315A806C
MKKVVIFAAIIIAVYLFSDIGKDFRINNAVYNFRSKCFASDTNRCVNMRVRTNVKLVNFYLSEVDDAKDKIASEIGEDGYEALVYQLHNVIESNKEDRPNWFMRTFVKDGQSWSAGNYVFYNGLFTSADLKILYRELYNKYGRDVGSPSVKIANENSGQNIVSESSGSSEYDQGIQTLKDSISYDSNVEDSSISNENRMEELIEQHIFDQAYINGAEEYSDARKTATGDLNGDGIQDTAVIYTLEGSGGGNGYFQNMTIFLGGADVPKAGNAIALPFHAYEAEIRNGQIIVQAKEHGPNDPNCCPSIEQEYAYHLDKGRLVNSF